MLFLIPTIKRSDRIQLFKNLKCPQHQKISIIVAFCLILILYVGTKKNNTKFCKIIEKSC